MFELPDSVKIVLLATCIYYPSKAKWSGSYGLLIEMSQQKGRAVLTLPGS
jgi:hypothetical protein